VAEAPGALKNSREAVLEAALKRAASRKNGKDQDIDDVYDTVDVLAHLILVMRGVSRKPVLKSPGLQDWMISYFGSMGRKTLGGASGNECSIKRKLDFPVLLHRAYHHKKQAELARKDAPCAKRLIFANGKPVTPPPSLGEISRASADDPRRFSCVVDIHRTVKENGEIEPVLRWSMGEEKPIRISERVIFQIVAPRTEIPHEFEKLKVIWKPASSRKRPPRGVRKDASGDWFVEIDWWNLDLASPGCKQECGSCETRCRDWPQIPAFQHPFESKGNTLVIRLAGREEMDETAQVVECVLLGGLQSLLKPLHGSEALMQLARAALIDQLSVLIVRPPRLGDGADNEPLASIPVHFELSGAPGEGETRSLAELLKQAGITHLGLNRQELEQITEINGSPYYFAPRPPIPESSYRAYERARFLLERIGNDTNYVHDPNLDILLRRNTGDISADEEALKRHVIAMLLAKVAVPADLQVRAVGSASFPLGLCAKSLFSVVQFARDYSQGCPPAARAEAYESLISNGFYYNPNGVSVAIAPTISMEFGPEVSLAGAGDRCFATHASAVGKP
jgi:hypothetical protein